MIQEPKKEIPPRFHVLLTAARGFYFTAGNLMFVTNFFEWKSKGYDWSEPSAWYALLGLTLMLLAIVGLTHKLLSTMVRTQPVLEVVSYTLWSNVVIGVGFLVLAFFLAIT